jgi:hypothetical protein
MKKIEPILIWDKGQVVEATILKAYAAHLELGKSAIFNYSLLSETDQGIVDKHLVGGNLDIIGQDYQEWNQDEFAWEWIASQLNLTITGDYIPPSLVQPVESINNEEDIIEEGTGE